jgi:hypothetical protein
MGIEVSFHKTTFSIIRTTQMARPGGATIGKNTLDRNGNWSNTEKTLRADPPDQQTGQNFGNSDESANDFAK